MATLNQLDHKLQKDKVEGTLAGRGDAMKVLLTTDCLSQLQMWEIDFSQGRKKDWRRGRKHGKQSKRGHQQKQKHQQQVVLLNVLQQQQQQQRDLEKNIVGEKLWTLISEKHPRRAGKITGMLLILEFDELYSLLESPRMLNDRVLEALQLLRLHEVSEKQELGEKLFVLISKQYPSLAGKITGMLLDLEIDELCNLLDSSRELNSRVLEARQILRCVFEHS